jgi:DNA polymerase III delta prime subunit
MGMPGPGDTVLLAGPSGSGKTEIALNLALSLLRTTSVPVTLADLDVVKPYFRLRDMLPLVAEDDRKRLNIIEPEHRLLHVDVPTFPPTLHASLSATDRVKIVDVGGDAIGVGAVAQFRETITNGRHALYVVVNTLRPGMNTHARLKQMLARIRAGARLDVTGLVANTNLQAETSAEEVQAGYEAVKALGDSEGLPIVAVVVSPEYADKVIPLLSPEAAQLVSVLHMFNRILDTVGSHTEF